MAALRIGQFGGIAPRINARALPENKAQTALNVDTTRRGSLLPTNGPGAALHTFPEDITTLFRYNEDYTAQDGKWWLASTNDVDFCRGQIVADDYEIVYFTDNDDATLAPQFTYNAAVSETPTTKIYGTLYGATASFDLGVAAPTLAPVVSSVPASTTDGLTAEYRTYVFTYVWSKAGRSMESGPSPAADVVEYFLDSDQVLTLDTLVSAPPAAHMASAEVKKRVYRSVSGTYLFVAEIPVDQQEFVDTVTPENLGTDELPSLTWAPPVAGLQGLTNMANGMMAGFSGRDVYFCEPYVPHAWPLTYAQSLPSPVVGMAAMDTTLVVLTNERPYFLQGSDPSVMTVVEADIAQGCVSKRSVVALNGAVYFSSPDGLVSISPSGSRIITETEFSYSQWNSLLDPSTVFGYAQDLKYYGFHSTGAFVYDIPSQEFTTLDVDSVVAAFADLRLDTLFTVDNDNRQIRPWGTGAPATFTWRSKKFTLPREVSFSCMQVEAESYPVTVKVYASGALLLSTSVSSRNMFRLPVMRAHDWEVELTGAVEVFSVAMAQSGEELATV